MSAAWLTALSSLALAVVAVLGWCTRHVVRVASRFIRFLDDYFGEPGRPGVPERPGVMARLQAVEESLARAAASAARAEAAAAQVLAETQPNGGTSLRDVVHRTARDVAGIRTTQKAIQQRLEQIEQRRQEGHGSG